jgi:hypothetical protein
MTEVPLSQTHLATGPANLWDSDQEVRWKHAGSPYAPELTDCSILLRRLSLNPLGNLRRFG